MDAMNSFLYVSTKSCSIQGCVCVWWQGAQCEVLYSAFDLRASYTPKGLLSLP